MICQQCAGAAAKAREVFTVTERTFILTAVSLMMRQMFDNPNSIAQDKIVGSSVTTKMLLSFPPAAGELLLRRLRESVGIDMKLSDCPHGVMILG